MKRVYVKMPDEQAAALKERAKVTGLLQAEIIRRAIASVLAQPTPLAFAPENQQRLELYEKTRTAAPVLFALKQETR
jgi:hypothetical protein